MEYLNGFEMAYRWDPFVLNLPEGNYTGSNLAASIQDLLNGFAATFDFEVVYHPARGTISIEAKSEGMGSHTKFYIPSDFGIMTWEGSNLYADYPWKNSEGFVQTIEINNLQPINGALRNTAMIHVYSETEYYISSESGFINISNVSHAYLHCPSLGHFNSIGVRGEKIPVSSSFGYLISDYAAAPHDKIDVSRQLRNKNNSISLRDVYGTAINLHGAAISCSLVFLTLDSLIIYNLKLFCSNKIH